MIIPKPIKENTVAPSVSATISVPDVSASCTGAAVVDIEGVPPVVVGSRLLERVGAGVAARAGVNVGTGVVGSRVGGSVPSDEGDAEGAS